MLQRFVSASVVASTLIAFGAVGLWIAKHVWQLQNVHQLAMLWCCVPLGWGIWALLTPRTWLPMRLPWWGAILGVLAAVTVLFLLNMPQRILGQYVGLTYRVIGMLIAVVGYYLLWMLVRVVYVDLRGPGQAEKEFKPAA